ncbi:MAG: tubulin-like doman-containing protein [Gammaproteobacteria bacterium]|jgi:hypothetical protein
MALEVNQRLLYVGLGGTGINTTIELESMLRKEMCGPDGTFLMRKHPELELRPFELPQYIQTILIDTDASAISKHRGAFESKNDDIYFKTTTRISDLSVSKSYGAIASGLRASMPEDVKSWLPTSESEPNVSPISAGAGQYPLVGRASLFNALQPNAESFLSNFDKAIESISQAKGLSTLGPKDGVSPDLYVYVAFSIAGGTGTGIYYDILHLLEEKIRREVPSLTTYIFPLVLLPQAFEEEQLANQYRLSKLNAGFAISDLAQLIDHQRQPKEELEKNFIQSYPGDLKIRVGGIQSKKRPISNAFLFTKGPNASLTDMYKSVAAFCLTNIGGDLKKDEGSTDAFTFFSDLINRPELDRADSSGPGFKPLSPAVGARLSIPVENISNLVTSYLVADTINTAFNDSLYVNEDRSETINLILKSSKLDFVNKENLLPEGLTLPNRPKKPGSTKDARELARKVIITYQNLLVDLEQKVKTEVSNRLLNITVDKIIQNTTQQNTDIDIFAILRALVGSKTDQSNSVLFKLNQFTNTPEPKDRFKVPPTLTRKNFESWLNAFEKDIKKNHLPYIWSKALLNDALFQSNVLSQWTESINKIRRSISDWNSQQAQQLNLAKVKLEGQGELVKEFLPQVGNLNQVFNLLKNNLEEEPSLAGLNDVERLTKIINSSSNTWNHIWSSSADSIDKFGLTLIDTIEGTIAQMLNSGVRKYFNEDQDSKPLVPNLKTILSSVKDIDNVDSIMKSSIDELVLQLGSLIGPGGLPSNTKYEDSDMEANPVVRVTYPADIRDNQIEAWLEKQLLNGGALQAVKNLTWDWEVSQGNSIVIAYTIMSHGILGNEDSFESLKLTFESEQKSAGVDKLPWRRRLGSSFTRIIGNEIDERRALVRLFLSLYTGQGQFKTETGPVAKLEDFANITSFVYKNSENAPEMIVPMESNLTNTPIPTFADSLLEFQFKASNNEIALFRFYIGGKEGYETPDFFSKGKPPKPHKSFVLLLNELRQQEIDNLNKKLNKSNNPRESYSYEKALEFWKQTIDEILNSPVVDVKQVDGKQFNTVGELIDYHNNQ